MPRFLTPDWVAACNEALARVTLPPLPEDAGLATETGRFAVTQLVTGGPDGDVRLSLSVDAGTIALSLGDAAAEGPGDGDGGEAPGNTGGRRPAGVTLRLSYDDAAALSKGDLQPTDAVAQGRIRVRGDLSILVAVHTLLDAARPALAPVHAATTY